MCAPFSMTGSTSLTTCSERNVKSDGQLQHSYNLYDYLTFMNLKNVPMTISRLRSRVVNLPNNTGEDALRSLCWNRGFVPANEIGQSVGSQHGHEAVQDAGRRRSAPSLGTGDAIAAAGIRRSPARTPERRRSVCRTAPKPHRGGAWRGLSSEGRCGIPHEI